MTDAPETIMAWVWDLPYPSRSQGKNVWSAVMYPSDQTVTAYRRADLPATRAQIMASPEVRALVGAAKNAVVAMQEAKGVIAAKRKWTILDGSVKDLRAALAAFKAMEAGE